MIQVIDVTLRSEERKEKRIEERKKEILQAAMTLYTNKKVSDITMQDIGKGVSFSRASIYNYFATKESIFLAFLMQHRAAMLRLLSSDWLGLRTDSTEAELVLFYHHWNMAWDSLRQCFKRFMPSMNKKKQDECMTCLTAYIHGLYPLSMISGTEHNLMKTAHMTQHPLSIFDAAYLGIDKILPK